MESHPQYEVLDEIGRGQAAIVYRARDLNLRRFVAIKALHEKLRRDPRQMEQFWDEAQFLANLEHENVVKVFAIEKEQGWIVMELMRGSLDTKLSQGPLPYDLVRSILHQTLEGLDYLHKNQKLHGAIKPANLLINDQGRVKLSDSAGNVAGGEIRKPKGSYKYLAPELLNPSFGEVTPTIDLYCLGFTALELLQGEKFNDLFPGVGPDAVDPELGWMRWHNSPTERLPPLEKIMPQLPQDLRQVIGRLLEKEVAERYASAEDALSDLKKLPIVLVDLPADKTGSTMRVETLGAGQAPLPVPPVNGKKKLKPNPKPAPGGGPPPWSKAWINKKLEDKRILAAVCALVILPALIFLFWPTEPELADFKISSTPPGADVYIDDTKKKNKTDYVFHLPPGKHTVRVELTGHKKSEDKQIDVKASVKNQSVQFQLEKISSPPNSDDLQDVQVLSTPSGADVFINDVKQKDRTNSKFQVQPGNHRVRVELTGYKKTEDKQIEVKAGANNDAVQFQLTPVDPPTPSTRSVVIRSTPPGAQVFLNNQQRTDAVFDLPIGESFSLLLKMPGYKDFPRTIVVPPGVGQYIVECPMIMSDKIDPSPGKRFALLVGARNRNGKVPEYDFAESDVESLRRILARAGYANEDIAVLKDDATVVNVRQRLSALAAAKRPSDSVLVVLVGPGAQLDGGAYFCPEGGDPAAKASLLSFQEIYGELANCNAGLKLLIVDACRSKKGIFPETCGEPPANTACLFGCSAGEESYRHIDWRHSVFMYSVIRAFSGEAATNNTLSVDQLKQFVAGKVSEYVSKEYPAQPSQLPKMIGRTSASMPLATLDPALSLYSRGRQKFEKGDNRPAIADFTEAIKLSPEFVDSLFQRAVANFSSDAYPQAISDCNEILKLDPKNAEAYALRGESKLESKHADEAIADLNEAIKLAPNYTSALSTRATAYREKGDYASAMKDFDDALSKAPLDPYIYNRRGVTFFMQKNWKKAEDDYLKSNELNRNFSSPYENLYKLYKQTGDKIKAEKWLEDGKKFGNMR